MLDQIIADMKSCEQTKGQSVYEHGQSVRDYIFNLIDMLKNGYPNDDWIIPPCLIQYKNQILDRLLSSDIIEKYALFHDCGKPYCKTIDQDGNVHFPNHASVSYGTWKKAGGSEDIGRLILWDMDIHTMKAEDVDEFCKKPEAITLLLSGLAEIHSNAKLFGGIDSLSFKIKWKRINQRAKAICKNLFEH